MDSAWVESVVRFRFRTDDLLQTHFAIAPLMDLVGATHVLRWPERYPEHRPWIDWARPRASGLELGPLDVAAPVGVEFYPVFLGPAARAAAPYRGRPRARGGAPARGRRRRDRARLSGWSASRGSRARSRTPPAGSSGWSRKCKPSGTRCGSRGGTAWRRCWRARSPGAHDGWRPRAPGRPSRTYTTPFAGGTTRSASRPRARRPPRSTSPAAGRSSFRPRSPGRSCGRARTAL